GIHAAEPARDRRVAAPLGRAQPAAEEHALPLRHVDAGLLHQPRRPEPDARAPPGAGAREGRAPPALPPRLRRPATTSPGTRTGSAERRGPERRALLTGGTSEGERWEVTRL